MASIGYATLQIIPSAAGFSSAVAGQTAAGMTAAGAAGGQRFGGGMLTAVKGAIAPLAGILAAVGIGSFLKESIDSLQRIERINAQTENAIKSMGGAAGVSARHIEDLAGALESATATEAESVQQGANLLLTFGNIKNTAGENNDIFDQTVRAMTDMSRAFDTTGSAVLDQSSAAVQLGKALNDPIKGVTALQRVGVSFTASQKKQIKSLVETGDVMGAQKLILGELNKQFGGSAEAFAKTTQGRIELAKHAIGTLGETITAGALPILGRFADVGANALNGLAERWPSIVAQVSGFFAPVFDVFDRVKVAVSAAVDAFRFGDVTSDGVVGVMERIGNTARGLIDLFRDGDFTSALRLGLGVEEDSPVIGVLLRIRDAALQVVPGLITLAGIVQTDVLPALLDLGGTALSAVATAADAVGPPLLAFGGFLVSTVLPVVRDLGVFLVTTAVPALLSLASTVLGTLVPALAAGVTWLNENRTAALVIAGVIGAVLLPVFINLGVQAAVSGARQVAVWVTTRAAAVSSSAAQFAAHYRVVAGWVASGLAAVRSGAQTVAIWTLYKVQAVQGAAVTVAAHARIVASHIATGAAATVAAARSAAAWVASAARTAGAFVVQNAAMVASRAVMVAGAVATGIATAAQWALNAALTANPIGLVIVAIVALVAAVVLAYRNSETFRNIVQAAWQGIQAAIGAVVDWITGTVVPWLQQAWLVIQVGAQVLWQVISGAFQAIRSTISSVVSAVVGFLQTAWANISGSTRSAWAAITGFVGERIQFAQTVVTTVVFAIRSILAATWSTIQGLTAAAWATIRDNAVTPIQGALATLTGLAGRIRDAISGAFTEARDRVLGLLSSWRAVGTDIIQGIVDGITGAAGRIASAARQAAQSALDSAKSLLGISSPSRVFRDQVGAMIGEGTAVGILRSAPKVAAAVASLTDVPLVTASPSVPSPRLDQDAGAGVRSTAADRPITINAYGAREDILARDITTKLRREQATAMVLAGAV